MQDVLGIVLTENNDTHLHALTKNRALAALPVAGRYRLVDFVLSNMANSDITHIGVTTQYNYRSLMYHIGAGKPWNLSRKVGGLFILPPYVISENVGISQGTISILNGIMGFLTTTHQKYVLIADSNVVCNIDYHKALQFHKEKDADITMIYMDGSEFTPETLSRSVLVNADESGRIRDMEINPRRALNKNVSMGMYIMEKVLLENLIEDCVAHGEQNFVMDIIQKNLREFKIYGYKFDGYCRIVDDIRSYFNFNFELLNSERRAQLFDPVRRIYTSVKDTIATKYGENARVTNSMIADGCTIDGTVENSIIFRDVIIKNGSTVANSIVMQNTKIYENCQLNNVILDKEVIINGGSQLIGQKNYPVVIEKKGKV